VDDWLPELRLGLGGRLPEDWIPEEEVRINLYARLARIGSAGEIEALAAELEDRFGTLPDETRRLIELARIRLLARAAGIARVDAGPAAIALTPRRALKGKVPKLEVKGERLLLRESTEEADRLDRVHELLEELASAT
jgi:transcription-repair coupling factor (superfamily II helicase)